MELLIYLVALIIIIGVPFLLAWRSMRDFQDKPSPKVTYGTFLVQHPEVLNGDFFQRINHLGLDRQFKKRINPFVFALERLAKGATRALVFFGPKELAREFPELSLLELEDYTQKIAANRLQCFELSLRKNARLADLKTHQLELLKHFQIDESEYLFLQMVLVPSANELFQAAVRVVVSAKESNRRVEIARQFEQKTKSQINLGRSAKRRSSSENFQSYQRRSLIPAQIEKFTLPGELILKIIKA